MKSCFDSGCIVRISELMLRRGGPRPLVSTCWFTHFAGRWYFNASWSPHRYHQFFFAKTNPKNVAKQPSHFHGSWLPSYPLVYKKPWTNHHVQWENSQHFYGHFPGALAARACRLFLRGEHQLLHRSCTAPGGYVGWFEKTWENHRFHSWWASRIDFRNSETYGGWVKEILHHQKDGWKPIMG